MNGISEREKMLLEDERLLAEFRALLNKILFTIKENKKENKGKDKDIKLIFNYYTQHLNKDEQFMFFRLIMNELSYRSIIVDPDTILNISNVRLRSVFLISFIVAIMLIIIGLFFGTTGVGGWVSEAGTKLYYMFSL